MVAIRSSNLLGSSIARMRSKSRRLEFLDEIVDAVA
jgi:hypothetical protein